MIPHIVGKLAPNSTHFTKGLIKSAPGRGYFRAIPSQNGEKIVTSPPPPPIVERLRGGTFHGEMNRCREARAGL